MKKFMFVWFSLISALLAEIHVVTTYPYLAEIAKEVGGEGVRVKSLASPKFDPHFILPKPSLIPALRKADLLVINGAGLEIGWLPPLIKRANNPKIRPGGEGFVDASRVVDLLGKTHAVSRAYGDVHPEGNPHYALDPHNVLPIAALIERKLETIDPASKRRYRENFDRFSREWREFLKDFDAKMARCRGKKVVQYHELYNYLLHRYGMESTGTIEPLPGIAPSSKHTVELIGMMKKEGVDTILQDVYHESKTARFIASKTEAKVVVLPHDVGAVEGADTLRKFYETVAERLCR